MLNKKLERYCQSRLLDWHIDEDKLTLSNEKVFKIVDDNQRLFDEDMEFLPTDGGEMIDGWVYEFGGRWYLQDIEEDSVQLNELVYYGKATQKLETKSFLGIHSGYELMNGVGLYKDWVRKAKFLGVETLGICEKGTLAGALVFQNECQRNNIKSVIGLTVPVKGISEFDVKLYVKNFQGWLNLLKLNSKINVDKEVRIEMSFLKESLDGLYFIADPKTMSIEDAIQVEEFIDFYQLDTVRFLNDEVDEKYINNLEKYLESDFNPISITDAYYLEKEDYLTREALWTVNKAFDDRTNNQYFKNKDQYAKELILMFESSDKSWIDLFKEAQANEKYLVETCNFEYDTQTRHLPKYEMTEEESKRFKTNEDLFSHLLKEGFKKLPAMKNQQLYIDRLKKEIEVLKLGDTIDYFLILHDIVKYARDRDMLTGIGRGSAGGSLVAYLLGIIHVDPLEFDLLFERFLNAGRMGRFEDRPFYIFQDGDEEMGLAEGALLKVIRNGKERIVLVHEVEQGDKIIKY